MPIKKAKGHFGTVAIGDVPKSRDGKHKKIVTLILRELAELETGAAIKVPLDGLGDTKANVRSALNRAARKSKLKVVTAADDKFLYIWNVAPDSTRVTR